MKVIEKGELLIVSSYPYKLAIACLAVVSLTLFTTLHQQLSLAAILLGFFVPTICLLVLDFKLSIFDSTSRKLLISQFSLRGKRRVLLTFDDIKEVRTQTHQGLKGNRNAGVVAVFTAENFYPITTLTDSNYRQQTALINRIEQLCLG
ncbi:hypothetical protein [Thalassotalea euphylliae]|uniref:PH domain-containing protein n=1 Tax=Thalassotalea euphylliae TaxID=1655234 RepID=A0A3E0UDS8_9GAMM|nr:hypothetical protein [Thalassotalea euphylliae]REL34723.1 hypothetical protein DXX92_04790 [Thalassotalea euphylliae]